jgi:FkbM family methyltransferase
MFTLGAVPGRVVSAYLRTFRFNAARWRLQRYALRQIRAHGASIGRATVSTHFGFKMELHLHDWVDQYIYASGTYEETTARTMAALLRPGDTCIDVGANVGFFTLLMATSVGPTGAVWAFEPSPTTRARLLRNIQLNQVAHVTLREEAVSNVDGERLFFGGPEDHSGVASLRPAQASSTSYEVRTCRLSTCLPESLRPSLIKMDIEGAEYLALQGMRELLQAHHPDLIIEMSRQHLLEMGTSPAEICTFLTQFGYRMYWFDSDGLVACHRCDETWPPEFNALFTLRQSLPAGIVLKRS